MKVVINDANILIDLAKLNLLSVFSQLDFEMHTTDFVVAELNEEQQALVNSLSEKGEMNIIETESEELLTIAEMQANNHGLSIEDCSVWYYSQQMTATLLTGDGKLRKLARQGGVEVRGIIYLFDELLKQELISFETAVEKMEELKAMNVRLPQAEIEKRLASWKQNKNL